MVGGVTIHLAGVPVCDELVLELARLVDDDTLGSRLETAYGQMTKVLALTIQSARRSSARSTIPRRGSRSSAPCCSASTAAGCGTASSRRSRRMIQSSCGNAWRPA